METTPLTRQHRSIAGVTEKWDLYIRGFELATGYSELIDPVVQRERFAEQARAAAAGDDEAMVLDEDFSGRLGARYAAVYRNRNGHRSVADGFDRPVNSRDCIVSYCASAYQLRLPSRCIE